MPDAGDFYRGLVPLVEEDSVVATAEAKAGLRRFKFFHIASAVGEVTVDAMENLNCGLSIDGPQIGTGFWRPVDNNALEGGVFAHCLRPNSRRISS